jgi:hypothetical protein
MGENPTPAIQRKTIQYSKPKNKASNTLIRLDKELLWQLVVAADGHLPTVASVVGVSPAAISEQMRGRYLAPRWRAWKTTQSEVRRRGKTRRGWWRWRLRGHGIEPVTLRPDDPTYAACYAPPRGHDVREAAAALRADGVDVRTAAGLARLLDDVAARVAARVGAAEAAPGEPAAAGEPDADDGEPDADDGEPAAR